MQLCTCASEKEGNKTRAPPTGAGRSTFSYLILNCKQAIYKVIHTSNYDGHISKYVCKIGKYNQRGIIFSCNTILVHM